MCVVQQLLCNTYAKYCGTQTPSTIPDSLIGKPLPDTVVQEHVALAHDQLSLAGVDQGAVKVVVNWILLGELHEVWIDAQPDVLEEGVSEAGHGQWLGQDLTDGVCNCTQTL